MESAVESGLCCLVKKTMPSPMATNRVEGQFQKRRVVYLPDFILAPCASRAIGVCCTSNSAHGGDGSCTREQGRNVLVNDGTEGTCTPSQAQRCFENALQRDSHWISNECVVARLTLKEQSFAGAFHGQYMNSGVEKGLRADGRSCPAIHTRPGPVRIACPHARAKEVRLQIFRRVW